MLFLHFFFTIQFILHIFFKLHPLIPPTIHFRYFSRSDLLHKYFVKVFFKPIHRITAGQQDTKDMEIDISLTYNVHCQPVS